MQLIKTIRRLFKKPEAPPSADAPPPKAVLREYLYVDARRLDAYVQQVRAPVAFDKVPQWSVELTAAGPKAAGQQLRPGRAMTVHEKTTLLVEYLQTTDDYEPGRPSDPTFYAGGAVLRSETCLATCVNLSRGPGHEQEPGLRIWISDKPQDQSTTTTTLRGQTARPGSLFLLEDDPYSDALLPSFFSAYSTLGILLEAFTTRLLWTPTQITDATRNFDAKFAADPVGALKRMGATIAQRPRWITTLYRVRTGTEQAVDDKNVQIATFAYPIVIFDGVVTL